MNYVDKNLIPGETVVYRGALTRLPYWWLVVPVGAAIAAAIYPFRLVPHSAPRLDPRGDTRRHQHSDVDTDPHASELD